MFFSFAILSLCIFSFKVVASAKYNLEIINFKQLVHAINIAWAHENKFKLHKNVSLIKFRAIKIRPLSFSRTLLARSAFWLTEMSMRQREQLRVSKKFAVFVSRSVFRQKNKNMYLFNQTNYHCFSTSDRTARLSGWPHLSCQRVHTAAHNPERATPTLGLCHGVFTDRFIFRHILGQFFTRKWNIHHAMNAVKN